MQDDDFRLLDGFDSPAPLGIKQEKYGHGSTEQTEEFEKASASWSDAAP